MGAHCIAIAGTSGLLGIVTTTKIFQHPVNIDSANSLHAYFLNDNDYELASATNFVEEITLN